MEKKRQRYEMQNCLLREYMKQMAVQKFITGEDLELWYREQNRTVRPVKLNFDEKRYKKKFYKVRTGEIFDELEVEKDFYEKDLTNASDKLVIKNKKFIESIPSRDNQRKF